MAEGLTDEELAYMRETQAAHRPTEATLARRVSTRTPGGGTEFTWGEGEPIQVRINSSPDEVPEALASRYSLGALAKASLDLVRDVRAGDRLTVSPTQVYEVVSEGEPDAWSTAQSVWLNRTKYPAR